MWFCELWICGLYYEWGWFVCFGPIWKRRRRPSRRRLHHPGHHPLHILEMEKKQAQIRRNERILSESERMMVRIKVFMLLVNLLPLLMAMLPKKWRWQSQRWKLQTRSRTCILFCVPLCLFVCHAENFMSDHDDNILGPFHSFHWIESLNTVVFVLCTLLKLCCSHFLWLWQWHGKQGGRRSEDSEDKWSNRGGQRKGTGKTDTGLDWLTWQLHTSHCHTNNDTECYIRLPHLLQIAFRTFFPDLLWVETGMKVQKTNCLQVGPKDKMFRV